MTTPRQLQIEATLKAIDDFAASHPAAGAVLGQMGDKGLDALATHIVSQLHPPYDPGKGSQYIDQLFDLPIGTMI